jgi:hypothetical protein
MGSYRYKEELDMGDLVFIGAEPKEKEDDKRQLLWKLVGVRNILFERQEELQILPLRKYEVTKTETFNDGSVYELLWVVPEENKEHIGYLSREFRKNKFGHFQEFVYKLHGLENNVNEKFAKFDLEGIEFILLCNKELGWEIPETAAYSKTMAKILETYREENNYGDCNNCQGKA